RSGRPTAYSARSCASAWPPQPQTARVRQPLRARCFDARALAAAVRSAVIEPESMIASGVPSVASLNITAPRIVGSPRDAFPGKFALTLAAKYGRSVVSKPALTWKLPCSACMARIAGSGAFPSPSMRKACSTAARQTSGASNRLTSAPSRNNTLNEARMRKDAEDPAPERGRNHRQLPQQEGRDGGDEHHTGEGVGRRGRCEVNDGKPDRARYGRADAAHGGTRPFERAESLEPRQDRQSSTKDGRKIAPAATAAPATPAT